MTFTPKDWKDSPDTSTPLTAAAIEDVEARLSGYTDSELATHTADTTAVHGITDTSVLETTSGSAAKVAAHEADTTNVHGIADTSALLLSGATAGGDLSGTYPNPQIGSGVIVNADVSASAAIAESKLSLASDAAAGTASRRTLGTSSTSACAGNDSRLSDTRTPTDGTVTAAKVAASLKPSGTAAAGDEALRALGTTSSTAAAGNDSRLSDSRTPSGSAGGDLTGTYPNPQIASGVIVDADVSASAAIAYSKLALAGSIVSADITDGTITGVDTDPAQNFAKEFTVPRDHNLNNNWRAWVGPPAKLFNNNALMTAGTRHIVRVPIFESFTCTKVIVAVNTAGSGMTAFYAGILDSSKSLLNVSSDVKASLQAGTGEVALTIPSTSLTAGTYVLVDLLAVGGTTPNLYRNASSLNATMANLGLPSSGKQYSTGGTGQTSITTNPTLTDAGQGFWVALAT